MSEQPKISCLAPWFGSNRTLAENVGEELKGCKWCGVPFAGGMSELLHIKASTIVVNDLHDHIINLAYVTQHPVLGVKLYKRLRRTPFHPWVLDVAQRACHTYERQSKTWDDEAKLNFAEMYFICCWMGRSAKAGTDNEFYGGLPIRWSATGGDSNTRFRSATQSLTAWRRILHNCNFSTLDVFDFLVKVKDEKRHGLYLDPPFPDAGDPYKHKFTDAQHRQLAQRLTEFQNIKIVCRFYDHPLIRELYPECQWQWKFATGRKQSNETAEEVLIIKGGEAC